MGKTLVFPPVDCRSNKTDTTLISDADFDKFRDFFYRKTGIKFSESKRYFVDKRLIERMEQTGHQSFRSYFSFMRFQASAQEVQKLINAMTVNETYFFREAYQFDCLVDNVMDEIVKNKISNNKGSKSSQTIRIWSIPSSTGEEPYSIALYLLEKWPGINQYNVEIVSSDIDSNVLASAKEGIYNERSIKLLPPEYKHKYFTPIGRGKYQINSDIRQSVKFTQVNLAEPTQTRSYRGFDIVFCRNLLIYFDDVSRRQAADIFFDALNPNGFVFLGHSESMSRISSLYKIRKFPKALVYQR